MARPPVALAYRPFDGTDADVASPGEFELELGPVGYVHESGGSRIVAPAAILNYGFAPSFEVVAEGRYGIFTRASRGQPTTQLSDSALSVKEVVRNGVLQGSHGVSIANEWSVLFADSGSEQGFGAELTTIFSARVRSLTLHLNLYNELSREQHYVGSVGPILEGPIHWGVRPVLELIFAREFGAPRFTQGLFGSVLLGAVGRMGKDFSVDIAIRHAQSRLLREDELRAGFTWAFETCNTR